MAGGVATPGRAVPARKGSGRDGKCSHRSFCLFVKFPFLGLGAGWGGSRGVSSLPLAPPPPPQAEPVAASPPSAPCRWHFPPVTASGGGGGQAEDPGGRPALPPQGSAQLRPPPPPPPGSVLSAQRGEGRPGFPGPQGRVGGRRALGGGGQAPVWQMQTPPAAAGPPRGPVAGW